MAFPVITIEAAADVGRVEAIMARVEDYRLVVFVSPNAIRAALARRDAPWPSDVTVGVMGPGSVATLAALGLQAPAVRIVAPVGGAVHGGGDRFDSESLFAALDAEIGLTARFDGRALILRGNGGRAWFADRLRSIGIPVDEVAAYRRVATPPDEAGTILMRTFYSSGAPAVFVVTSSESIDRLAERVEEALAGIASRSDGAAWLRRTPLLVPHRRIAENAARAGFGRVVLCGPGDDGILAAIE